MYPAKPMMSEEQKQVLLSEAVRKNKRVCIQTVFLDKDGCHLPDTIGLVQGGEDGVLYIAGELLSLEDIRHIVILENEKWWKNAVR